MQARLRGIAVRAYQHAPMQTLTHAVVTVDKGVAHDARGKPSLRQVTILSEASWLLVCHQLKVLQPTLPPYAFSWLNRRANLLISHRIFNTTDIGSTLRIGSCVLEITQPCNPCVKMDQHIKGLQALLTPALTAGVCCKVISGGYIKLGDQVTLTPQPYQALLL
ncbi:MOSC domain-containing protein [Marinagarivorans algicola]|uniref:MOSC domain-containing protein n=1 Tax=Marinagarivorans algicola TaxID=1513270 RepID=UPI0006B898E7|nr:MOSC domain-containing protein [Marinagarivorans algicola]